MFASGTWDPGWRAIDVCNEAAKDPMQERASNREAISSKCQKGGGQVSIGECNAGGFCEISALQHVRIAMKHETVRRMNDEGIPILSAKLSRRP